MPDHDLINRIRSIFLHQRPHVTIAEATVLLGWSRGEMSRAIADGEVEVMATALGRWLWREEVMAKALELWAPEVIEEALGADADSVLPEAVRLIDLHVRLPRHQVAMLEHFAERDRTSVSGGSLGSWMGWRVRTRRSFRGRWRGSRTRWRGRMRRRGWQLPC